MLIQINYGTVDKTDAIERFVEYKINTEFERFADQITRVEVHLHDDNGGKAGSHDKRCVLEARPAGLQPVVAEHASDDLDKAVAEAVGKLSRVLKKTFDKRREA